MMRLTQAIAEKVTSVVVEGEREVVKAGRARQRDYLSWGDLLLCLIVT